MNIRKCVRCGNLFAPLNTSISKRVCTDCREKEEEDFCKVRDYLREYPSSGIRDICEATGVEEKLIIKYLKEGRLETTTKNYLLNCEKCNVPIKTGRYCTQCTAKLSKNISSICARKEEEEIVESILTKIQLRGRR